MFDKRNDNKQSASRVSSSSTTTAPAVTVKSAMIGPGIKIIGDISGNENLVIEGKVEGKIQLPGHQVEVGESGKVHADIVAKFIKVDGELQGDIDAKEKVVITKSGNVRGNITAPRVLLEDGAMFKGSIDINPVDTAPVELPLTAKRTADNVKKLGNDIAKNDPGYTVKSSS